MRQRRDAGLFITLLLGRSEYLPSCRSACAGCLVAARAPEANPAVGARQVQPVRPAPPFCAGCRHPGQAFRCLMDRLRRHACHADFQPRRWWAVRFSILHGAGKPGAANTGPLAFQHLAPMPPRGTSVAIGLLSSILQPSTRSSCSRRWRASARCSRPLAPTPTEPASPGKSRRPSRRLFCFMARRCRTRDWQAQDRTMHRARSMPARCRAWSSRTRRSGRSHGDAPVPARKGRPHSPQR